MARKMTWILALATVVGATALGAAGDGPMEHYLVRCTFIDPGAMMPPEAGLAMYDNAVGPSLKMLAEWEKAGKIMGGIVVGERAGAFIAKASSNKALDEMLQSLPFWGLLDWEITPLVGFHDRLTRDMAHMDAMREMMKGQQ